MEFSGPIEVVRNFAIALFIGALVGLEREKKKAAEHDQGLGGIRTFILFAMAGAVSAWLSSELGNAWIFIATIAGVTTMVVVGYFVQVQRDLASPGLTTEVAALLVCLLGGLTLFGYPGIAVALGIATSALLAFKAPIHGAVRKIGAEDLYAGLKLLIASFIVLPLLPNRTIDPLEVLNPYKLWLLVILISAISLVGYIAVRVLGTRRGTALTGVFGGLVSSTAVTLAFARQSMQRSARKGGLDVLAAGILLAWVVMPIRILVEIAVVYAPLLPRLAAPLAAMGIVTVGLAFWLLRRGAGEQAPGESEVKLSNPFSLTAAFKFALLFTLVLVVVGLVERYLPTQGLYVVAAMAGLTDVDAITLTLAGRARDTQDATIATSGIMIAAFANTLTKAGLVAALGAAPLRLLLLTSAGAIILAGGAVLLVR